MIKYAGRPFLLVCDLSSLVFGQNLATSFEVDYPSLFRKRCINVAHLGLKAGTRIELYRSYNPKLLYQSLNSLVYILRICVWCVILN